MIWCGCEAHPRTGAELELWGRWAANVCRRHWGIGADGVILCSRVDDAEESLQMTILNADGSLAAMCGNGIRCLAAFAHCSGQRLIAPGESVLVHTASGKRYVSLSLMDSVCAEGGVPEVCQVRVDMGRPYFTWPAGVKDCLASVQDDVAAETSVALSDGTVCPCLFVSMGNPHLPVFVPSLSRVDVGQEGGRLEKFFPEGCNIEFVEVASELEPGSALPSLNVGVWERGAGVTLACGTGACAAWAAANCLGLLGGAAHVNLPGGRLLIEKFGESILMTGPARKVFEGSCPGPDT